MDRFAFRNVKLLSISIESGNERFVVRDDLLIDIVDQILIRNLSNSSSVIIPRDIEVLGSACFSQWESLQSVSFESDSHLSRIESRTFSDSSLHSIVIPRGVRFIDGSAFQDLNLSSLSIENGTLKTASIRPWISRNSVRAWFDASILILPKRLFRESKTLCSISFESNSQLTRIEIEAFARSSLRSIFIPRSVEILCSECFSFCQSLNSVSFEANSRLTRIEFRAFSDSSLQSIVIPRGVRFVDRFAFQNAELASISIESGNERFVIRDESLMDIVDHKLTRRFWS
jgi:hypothetical protein